MAGFGDIWGAVNEGVDADQNMINNYYHNQAQNALTQMYGPISGNPQAALQMQNYNYLNQQDQQYITQQRIANEQGQTNLDYDRSNNPIRLQQNQGAADVSTAQGQTALQTQPSSAAAANAQNTGVAATAVPSAQATLAQQQAKAQQDQIAAASVQGYAHVQAVTAFTDYAQKALANGQPPDGAFRGGVNAAIAAGATPQEAELLASQYEQQFLQNPTGTIAALSQLSQSAYNSRMAGMSPVDLANLKAKYLEYQQNKANLVTTAQKNYTGARSDEDEYLGAQGPLGVQIASVHAGQDALANMQNMIDTGKIDSAGLARIAKKDFVPGTDEAKFEKYAEQAASVLSLSNMQAIKQETGGAASGIRNETEYEGAGKAIATFDQNLSPAQLRQQILNAKRYMDTAASVGENQIEKLGGRYPGIVARRRQAEQDYNAALNVGPADVATGAYPGAPSTVPTPSGAPASTPVPSNSASSASPAPSPPASSAPPGPPASASKVGPVTGDWREAAARVGITPAQMATMSPSEIAQFQQLAGAGGGTTPGAGTDALRATEQNYAVDVPKTAPLPAIAQAIWGQESGNRSNVANSVNGAVGPGQIMPATFAAYAKPGERIDNPADNRAVSARILADYSRRYNGDPARVAVAYFSGPGNVAPANSPTPYIRDSADGNGKRVSSYVGDVLGRLTSAPPTQFASNAPSPNVSGAPAALTRPSLSTPQNATPQPSAEQSNTPQNTKRPETTPSETAPTKSSGAQTTSGVPNQGGSTSQGVNPQLAALQAEALFKRQVAGVMDGRALLAKYLGKQSEARTA